MKILIMITVIIILLLLYSVKIVYSFRLKNFDFSLTITLKTPFSKELFNNIKPKKVNEVKKEENSDKSEKKFDLKTIGELKEPITVVIAQICRILKKHCRITKLSTFVKTALEDPMENGIAFGIISGVLNIGTAILKDKCNVKNTELEIVSDFYSEEGVIFESCGTLKIRPIVLAVSIISNIKLIKAVKNILAIFKREDIENG